ncbi:HAD-IIA family hydrolase [Cryptosporangium aurantiacum]|uniref:Haloacid Dehalogenase Superfamily Class (Subfamily) IIA n=1 Tax=Cryptosporangium aurantiacum TaxID=134849 RepID=A0A1M7RNE0_9ACTN|nr:HAD-IIA family hydrolase [Cryptosporangium aurantiacum]SHN47845.1 Haloacid Dehalogenase Superfamily Class (subfamily) IIA [Cryptosporangium aurantiacum]
MSGLPGSETPLTERYDAALFDLDGVLYLQEEPIAFAPDGVAAARAAGMRIGFVTNNASRRAPDVVALLARVGVEGSEDEVVTAAQASAALLAEELPVGAPVLVVGAQGLADEVADVGLRPVRSADEKPAAVVQGYAREVGWEQLAEASVALRAGALWVATNRDFTIPSSRGPLPGNGALVAALVTAVRREPDVVVGKPHPRLHQESVRRTGAQRPLVIGDRLDTDMAGAVNGGADSLLVLTGVTEASDLLAAGPGERPTYVAADLRGLAVPHPAMVPSADGFTCGGWTTRVDGSAVVLRGSGSDDVDALRALAVAAWSLPSPSAVKGEGADAAAALRALQL